MHVASLAPLAVAASVHLYIDDAAVGSIDAGCNRPGGEPLLQGRRPTVPTMRSQRTNDRGMNVRTVRPRNGECRVRIGRVIAGHVVLAVNAERRGERGD